MDTEQTIQEMKAKTYAYLSSVLIGLLIPNFLLSLYTLIWSFNEFLTYGSTPTPLIDYGKEHFMPPNELLVRALMLFGFTLPLIILIRFYIKRIKSIRKKRVPLIISISIIVLSIPVWGFFSLHLLNALFRLLRDFLSALF